MILRGARSYPSKIIIGDDVWKVKFVRKLSVGTTGECDYSKLEIRIKTGLSKLEILKTFVHEVAHAYELEFDKDVPHELIYFFEEAVTQFLLDNF